MIKKTIKQEKNIFILLTAFTLLLIFFCSKMSPLYPFNEWADVNLYFNIGKAIFNGKVPYTEVFDHKGPLIFFIYGIGYLLSNTTFVGMYLIESLAWIFMIFAAYLTARLYVEQIYAFGITLLFSVFMISHASEGGSAEEFIAVFQVISLFLFIRYFKDAATKEHNPIHMLIHGLMCSMTLLIKINLVIFWVFPLIAIFINLILKKEYRNLTQNIIAYVIGLLIIILPIWLYFFINNANSEAWDIYITLNKSYAKIGNLNEVLEALIIKFYLRLRFETFEFVVILLGVLYFPFKYIENKLGRISLILSFVALFVAIFVSPRYMYYYSIPYYVFSLLGCIALSQFISIKPSKVAYTIIFCLILTLGIKQREFFNMKISELLRKEDPQTLVFQFSKIIEKEKRPTLLNLGLDSGNGVFTQTNIMPSVKYFVSPNLTQDIYPQMRNDQTEYIKNKEIQFIILADHSENFDYFSNLPYLNENYTIVDTYLEDGFKTYYLYKRKD